MRRLKHPSPPTQFLSERDDESSFDSSDSAYDISDVGEASGTKHDTRQDAGASSAIDDGLGELEPRSDAISKQLVVAVFARSTICPAL